MKFTKKVEDDFVLNIRSMSVNNEISLSKLKFTRKKTKISAIKNSCKIKE
jgi:hypothetical protein